MSRHRVTDAIDSLLGTTSPGRGDSVHVNRAGVYSNFDAPDAPSTQFDRCSDGRHGRLRGSRRCTGCGRTRNEIEIEEGT